MIKELIESSLSPKEILKESQSNKHVIQIWSVEKSFYRPNQTLDGLIGRLKRLDDTAKEGAPRGSSRGVRYLYVTSNLSSKEITQVIEALKQEHGFLRYDLQKVRQF